MIRFISLFKNPPVCNALNLPFYVTKNLQIQENVDMMTAHFYQWINDLHRDHNSHFLNCISIDVVLANFVLGLIVGNVSHAL
jgi:hypothetical protein